MPRKPKISREAVIEAALGLVDEQGIELLSMRSVAARLGVQAMALYHHVRHKEDLLGALLELLMADVKLPEPNGRWRRELEVGSLSFYRAFAAHPRVLPLFFTHPAHGSSAARPFAVWMLERLREAIPQEIDRVYAHEALYGYVIGQTAAQGLVPPLFERAGSAPKSHELSFELGLGALLSGVERRSPF